MSQAAETESIASRPSLPARMKHWLLHETPTWAASMLIHTVALLMAGLIFGRAVPPKPVGEAPEFEAIDEENMEVTQLENFELGETPLDPTVLDTASLMEMEAPQVAQDEQYNDASDVFTEAGGGTATAAETSFGGLGVDLMATGPGPVATGRGGLDGGSGFGERAGSGGAGAGYGARTGTGSRKKLLGQGGTRQSERAVAAALNWIARHQNPDGSWSVAHNTKGCTDGTCTGGGGEKSDSGATALALLPFLAAGQTHKSKGLYTQRILGGVVWLVQHQKPGGDLSAGSGQVMYSHGLATIALCEAYGMSKDARVGGPAQAAIQFIESGQDPKTGGWWYKHKQPGGDTSVFGWQVMALKSAQMAGLRVTPAKMELAQKWLTSVASGSSKGLFQYTPGRGASSTMTAVGLLTTQYLGAKKTDPAIIEGTSSLMRALPNPKAPNTYYWYYATQVMHNLPGPDWDKWNRQTRRVLIDSQAKKGCATGSWDPTTDPWGKQGGRIMVTSLAALTLEVYYRYLPLYQLDEGDKALQNMLDKPKAEAKPVAAAK